jgi:predicted lipoprotein
MIDRRVACLALTLAVAMPLTGCKVVSIAEEAATAPAGFDAAVYADGLWADQVLPHFAQAAHPAAEVVSNIAADLHAAGTQFGYRAGEGSPWSFIVSGIGTVSSKNTDSRAGTLELAVEGVAAPVVLQVGPVIRGNAIRDGLPFVSFQDFTNQLEYANAGKALTALAVAGFAGNIEAIAVGDQVSFTGAISMAAASDKVMITPVSIEKVTP